MHDVRSGTGGLGLRRDDTTTRAGETMGGVPGGRHHEDDEGGRGEKRGAAEREGDRGHGEEGSGE